MKTPSRPHKEQPGKVSSKAEVARKSKTKKRRKRRPGKRRTRWTCNGLRMRSWRRLWNEEGEKEVPRRRRSCKRYMNWHYMNECPKVKKREARKKRRKLKDGLLKR